MHDILRIVRIVLSVVFGTLGFFIIYSYNVNKNFGVILGGGVYLLASALSISLSAWWPLIVGFIIVHILQKIGFNPY